MRKQDIGVYEYVDETATSVERTTLLSTPETILSADQTTTIHTAALKQFGKSDNTDCVTLSAPSHASSCAATPTPMECADTNGECAEGEDEGDIALPAEADTNPEPEEDHHLNTTCCVSGSKSGHCAECTVIGRCMRCNRRLRIAKH